MTERKKTPAPGQVPVDPLEELEQISDDILDEKTVDKSPMAQEAKGADWKGLMKAVLQVLTVLAAAGGGYFGGHFGDLSPTDVLKAGVEGILVLVLIGMMVLQTRRDALNERRIEQRDAQHERGYERLNRRMERQIILLGSNMTRSAEMTASIVKAIDESAMKTRHDIRDSLAPMLSNIQSDISDAVAGLNETIGELRVEVARIDGRPRSQS